MPKERRIRAAQEASWVGERVAERSGVMWARSREWAQSTPK
jgi:hypothetical protein